MKLDGRNRIVYECDNAVRKKTAEGSVHTILNRDGLEAMLLDRALCTKEMEHRVMNAMNGIGEWYGPAVTDILYTHGRFKGYVFYKEPEPEPEPFVPDPVIRETPDLAANIYDVPGVTGPAAGGRQASNSYNTLVRGIYLAGSVALLGFAAAKVIYPQMLQRAYHTGSDIGSYFEMLSLHGYLGIGVAVILSLICGIHYFHRSAILYYLSLPVVFLSSAALLYLVLQIGIGLATAAIEILVGLIPGAIAIIAVLIVLKSIFE